jgi:hypothetical protein
MYSCKNELAWVIVRSCTAAAFALDAPSGMLCRVNVWPFVPRVQFPVRRRFFEPGTAKPMDNWYFRSQLLAEQQISLFFSLLAGNSCDRMIADAVGGRAAIFREIERHRSALAKQLWQAVGQIEDAEFK